MGLFDRLLSFGSGGGNAQSRTPAAKPKPKKVTEAVYLAPDDATSLGDVKFMRRSNTIRHTFPGSASSPGQKERVAEVDSMAARVEKVSEGLPGSPEAAAAVSLAGGVPKPVKKTFVKQMSQSELKQRQKGSAVAPVNTPVNTPANATAGPAASQQQPAAPSPAAQPSSLDSAKPGTIDPFRQMVKDLNT
ncbi:MAG: hypothetical protein AAFX65_01330 [Cyanobacteria bacterium J06638_7]